MEESQDTLTKAKEANDPCMWDDVWKSKDQAERRAAGLSFIYDRIEYLLPKGVTVHDFGGGAGMLCQVLLDGGKIVKAEVWDHSKQACDECIKKGIEAQQVGLETPWDEIEPEADKVVVGTEILEHLSTEGRGRILKYAAQCHSGMFSVPNNRLGPETESQHTVQYTALQFKEELQQYFEHVRIEVYGPFLLGVCGTLAKKDFTLSVTLPVRDEADGLEKTLASFRGIADEMVVGIDPRTTDNTYEIAAAYAEKVFYIDAPQGPPEEYQGDLGVHFSWCRNQCIDKCSSKWIFMTEGHENLEEGQDLLLQLGTIIPEKALVGIVAREGNGQRWGFPWLFRKVPSIKFERPVHNSLYFPPKTYVVHLPQVVTKHDRVHSRTKERAEQRKVQNRITLFDDWLSRSSTHSLFYLAQEWRAFDPKRSIERFEQLLKTTNQGSQRYQARLILAKEYIFKKDSSAARDTLIPAVGDDWERSEHWIWLGDIAIAEKKYEEAYTFYKYATTKIGDMPFVLWWFDISNYTYLPAQRMAMVCALLGKYEEGCHWAKKATELLPDDAPTELVDEAEANVGIFEEALDDERTN